MGGRLYTTKSRISVYQDEIAPSAPMRYASPGEVFLCLGLSPGRHYLKVLTADGVGLVDRHHTGLRVEAE